MFVTCIGVLQMVEVDLARNGFTGPLPDAWSSNMTQLQRLRLYSNSLTGSLPKSWAALTQVSSTLLPICFALPFFQEFPFARP